MKFNFKIRIIATLLIVTGLLTLAPIYYYSLKNREAVAANSGTIPVLHLKPSPTLITGQPVGINIPSLKMNLAVIPGIYNPRNGQWNLTLDKAQFAEPSVQPNNLEGNTLIYGHYRPEVFAYLHLIKPGAQAVVTTSNGYTFTYTYQDTQPYDPTDTSIFAYQGIPRLTIQTCSGAYMQNRQMYYFEYNGFTKTS